jgi:hypothetical protein
MLAVASKPSAAGSSPSRPLPLESGEFMHSLPPRLAQRLLVLNLGKISAIELRLQLLLEESRLGQQGCETEFLLI